MLWNLVWLALFRPTPKPLSAWRVFLLRLFGAEIYGAPFVSQSANIKMPWNLVLEDRACLGANCNIYNLARVTLRNKAVIAQEVYVCCGTHDFDDEALPLVIGEIVVGEDAFIGARAFLMPGIEIGEGAVVGACSVVTKDVPSHTVVAGNPAKVVASRPVARK